MFRKHKGSANRGMRSGRGCEPSIWQVNAPLYPEMAHQTACSLAVRFSPRLCWTPVKQNVMFVLEQRARTKRTTLHPRRPPPAHTLAPSMVCAQGPPRWDVHCCSCTQETPPLRPSEASAESPTCPSSLAASAPCPLSAGGPTATRHASQEGQLPLRIRPNSLNQGGTG